jgi:hypothetical protein
MAKNWKGWRQKLGGVSYSPTNIDNLIEQGVSNLFKVVQVYEWEPGTEEIGGGFNVPRKFDV